MPYLIDYSDTPFRKPVLRDLDAQDNVFNLYITVSRTLLLEERADLAEEFLKRAFKAKSFEDAKGICKEYADITWFNLPEDAHE